jgi:MFS family permease
VNFQRHLLLLTPEKPLSDLMTHFEERLMNREEKRVMGLVTSSHALVHLYEGVLPPLIPLLMKEFGTDYFHLGIVVTIFSYAFGFGAFPAGLLADRFSPRRIVTIYLFGSGIICLFIWPVGSIVWYTVLMGLIGLFCSTFHPVSNTLISHAIGEKGKAFGINGIAGSLGVAIAPVLSAWIGSAAGWRAPHVLFGLIGIAIGFWSLTLTTKTVTSGSVRSAGETGDSSHSYPYVTLVIFFMGSVALGLTYKGIMTFLPVYMGENVHLAFLRLDALALGGTMATLALLSGALGQYLAGRLVDFYLPEKIYFGTVALGTLFVFAMAMTSDIILIVSSVLYAFCYFATQPIQNLILSRYMPKHRQGLGFGLHFFLNFGVGSTAAAASGYLADHFGLKSVFYAMGVCFIIASFLTLLLLIRSRR